MVVKDEKTEGAVATAAAAVLAPKRRQTKAEKEAELNAAALAAKAAAAADKVRRCRSTLWNPCWKRLDVSA